MPDIDMCDDKSCPMKLDCYRYWAEPTPDQQPYLEETYRIDRQCPRKNPMRFPIEEVLPNVRADHRLIVDIVEYATLNNLSIYIDFTVVSEDEANRSLVEMHKIYFKKFTPSSGAGAPAPAPLLARPRQ